MRRIGRTGIEAFWALLMPVIILGTIYSGIATPTEAAAIALVYAVVVGFAFHRGLNVRNFPSTIARAAITTGSIVAVLFFLFAMRRLAPGDPGAQVGVSRLQIRFGDVVFFNPLLLFLRSIPP